MNLASWIILVVVIAIVALAIRATFFKKNRKGGCCDTGDSPVTCDACHCSSCSSCPINKNTLQPTIKPIEK